MNCTIFYFFLNKSTNVNSSAFCCAMYKSVCVLVSVCDYYKHQGRSVWQAIIINKSMLKVYNTPHTHGTMLLKVNTRYWKVNTLCAII